MLQSLQVPRQWSAPLQAHVHAEGILWLSVLPLPLICNLIPEAPESSQDPGHQASLKSGGERVVWDSQGSQLPGGRMGRSMGASLQGVLGPRLSVNNQALPHRAFLLPRQALTHYFNSPRDTEHPPLLCCPAFFFFSDELLGDGLCSCAVPDWWVGVLGAVRSLVVGGGSSGLCLAGKAGGAEGKGEDSCPV